MVVAWGNFQHGEDYGHLCSPLYGHTTTKFAHYNWVTFKFGTHYHYVISTFIVVSLKFSRRSLCGCVKYFGHDPSYLLAKLVPMHNEEKLSILLCDIIIAVAFVRYSEIHTKTTFVQLLRLHCNLHNCRYTDFRRTRLWMDKPVFDGTKSLRFE